MQSRLTLIAYLATLFTLGAALASAQQAPASSQTAAIPLHGDAAHDWPQTVAPFKSSHGKLYVVTLDHPHHHYTCNLQAIDDAGLTCAAAGLHPARTFARATIAALISPGHHDSVWSYLLIGAVIGAGILTAGAFLAAASTAAAISLYVLGSVFLMIWPIGLMGDNDGADQLLYQRPNTPLTVTLR
jgi:hypothetical protein